MNYDLIVIGSGPGGYVAAIRAAQLGLKTACVEKGPLGGTCLNVGCIPSKALLHSSELFAKLSHHYPEHGIQINDASFDFPKMMARKSTIVSNFNSGIAALFQKNKIDHLKGTGSLVNPTTVQLDSGETHTATNIILATGSTPTTLPFLPIDEKQILTSTGALSLETVPKKLLVIGAGVIGVELGSVYNRLGSEVTFLEFLPKICPTLDDTLSTQFQKILEAQGLTFHLNTKVTSSEKTTSGILLKTDADTYEADAVLCSIGRKPYTDGLNLDAVNIEPNPQGFLPVNGRFQTTQPNIYAIGDLIDGPMLAHKASEEGVAVAELIAGQSPSIDYLAVPTVIYTEPEVATVGLTEEEAKASFRLETGSFPLKINSRAQCTGEGEGLVKIIADAETDKLLGIHIISAHASEIIAEAVLAIEHRLTALELANTVHAHPTLSEALKEAALAVHKRPIHR